MTIQAFLAVFIGAGAGAVLRWWLGLLLNPLFPTVPMGTLAANLSGGYLMGLALGYFTHYEALSVEVRLLITTGFLGGLTTFSTFSGEVVTLIARQQLGWATAAIGLHLLGSLACTALGIFTIQWLKSGALP
jgi:CrcB protein